MNPEWFAGRLRELRVAAGLTQQQLADMAGLKLGGVRHLEQGTRSPNWETVLALCKALGVEAGAFTVPPRPAPTPERGRPRKDAGYVEAPAKAKAKASKPKRKRK